MGKITIEPLQSGETDEASVLLSRAYSHTPLIRAAFCEPGDKQRRILDTGFKNSIAKRLGKVLLAKDGEHIIGVMRIIKWPDCQKRSGYDLNKLPQDMALRVGEWKSIWAEHDPREPHWHLGPIGVLPEEQNRGAGSLLLEYYCGYVDELGQAAYLETDQARNVQLYKRFGFNVVGKTQILSIPNWFMWRPSRSE